MRPRATARTISLADIRGAETRDRFMLEVRIAILTAKDTIRLDGGRRGVGAAPKVIEDLRRRIAA